MNEIADWRKVRNQAMIDLDIKYVRQQIPMISCDEVALAAIHKARYECKDIEDLLRHESRRWLQDNGYSRFDGCGSFLPENELPI